LGHRGGGRGTRTGVEDGQLAEHVRGPEDAEQVLPAVGGLAADLHLPGQDDVQLVTGLTLLEDDVAARELHALQRLRQRLRGGRLDALEDARPGKNLAHLMPPVARDICPAHGPCRRSLRADPIYGWRGCANPPGSSAVRVSTDGGRGPAQRGRRDDAAGTAQEPGRCPACKALSPREVAPTRGTPRRPSPAR